MMNITNIISSVTINAIINTTIINIMIYMVTCRKLYALGDSSKVSSSEVSCSSSISAGISSVKDLSS